MIAITYTYDPARTDIAEIRPAHRQYLGSLFERGLLAASGPTGQDSSGALLLFHGDDVDAATQLTGDDPFVASGIVSNLEATVWTPVYGPWDS